MFVCPECEERFRIEYVSVSGDMEELETALGTDDFDYYECRCGVCETKWKVIVVLDD